VVFNLFQFQFLPRRQFGIFKAGVDDLHFPVEDTDAPAQ
jgi:hypothetical protein